MRLGARHAYLTRVLADGRVIDVQPWRLGLAVLVVSASAERWTWQAFYWYGSAQLAALAALAWDGTGEPPGGQRRPRCEGVV